MPLDSKIERIIVNAYLKDPVVAEKFFAGHSGTKPRSKGVVVNSLKEAVQQYWRHDG